jgi:hypothetical protein
MSLSAQQLGGTKEHLLGTGGEAGSKILTGEYQPESISRRDGVGEQFGVSRTAVAKR